VNFRTVEVFNTKLIERDDSVQPPTHEFSLGVGVLLLVTAPEFEGSKERRFPIRRSKDVNGLVPSHRPFALDQAQESHLRREPVISHAAMMPDRLSGEKTVHTRVSANHSRAVARRITTTGLSEHTVARGSV
jgi:hypothetical protein